MSCDCNQAVCLVMQAQHDYLQGNYPVVREDASQMCALQMQADAGPTILDQSDGLEPYLEKFIVRQVWYHFVTVRQVWYHCATVRHVWYHLVAVRQRPPIYQNRMVVWYGIPLWLTGRYDSVV